MLFAQWFIRLVLQSSPVHSLLFHKTPQHLFLHLNKNGNLSILQPLDAQDEGKSSVTHLPFCPSQLRLLPLPEGRGDVLGLDPGSQEGEGATGHAPLSLLNPSAPGRGHGLGALTPAPAALLPFGALGITLGAGKKNAGAERGCRRRAERSTARGTAASPRWGMFGLC